MCSVLRSKLKQDMLPGDVVVVRINATQLQNAILTEHPNGDLCLLSWQWVYVQRWLRIQPVAAAVPGTSPTPRPYPSRFPRPISTRSVSRIWRMDTSVTIRRVRTRTHGGVASATAWICSRAPAG
jgi:hypothetical protein